MKSRMGNGIFNSRPWMTCSCNDVLMMYNTCGMLKYDWNVACEIENGEWNIQFSA